MEGVAIGLEPQAALSYSNMDATQQHQLKHELTASPIERFTRILSDSTNELALHVLLRAIGLKQIQDAG